MTRTYTHPSVLAGIAAGASWADPTMDPAEIDWTARLAVAAIPFQVIDGRPVNPCQRTGIDHGRNELGHWGEQQCADAVVIVTDQDGRWLAMVERSDGHGWALPGGYVDAGERATTAAARELAEETGLLLPLDSLVPLRPRYVPDPRASDESWMVTTPCLARIPSRSPIHGSDDAARAEWIPAESYTGLVAYLDARGGEVFPAHRELLRDLFILWGVTTPALG